jgi:hypothetical protein
MLLAAKTGWSERFIRWQLPLARGHSYLHMVRLMEGEATQWPYQEALNEQWIHSIRHWASSASTDH